MAKPEANFWNLIKTNTKNANLRIDWQRIETGGTTQGVPDLHGCTASGQTAWVELKIASGNKVKLTKEQVAWHVRRNRGFKDNTWILVRKETKASDAVYLYSGADAIEVFQLGLTLPPVYVMLRDSKSIAFDWLAIMEVIFKCSKTDLTGSE